MKIAVLYICTGNYSMFWEDFYQQSKKNFYPEHKKEYFVFTDDQEIIKEKRNDVHILYQKKAGWPYDTLLRFQWFSSVQDILLQYDSCYYFNANTEFKGAITESIIPFPDKKEPLIFWCHTNYKNDNYGDTFNPERNPLSTAYVKEGEMCRCYGGGFFGGLSREFNQMCIDLRNAISEDLSNGIIAIWHDQSHIIKYATNHAHKEVNWGIISEEEYIPDADKCLIVFIAKKRFGGNDKLRDADFATRLHHLPVKIYSKALSVLGKLHLDNILRKTVGKLKNIKNGNNKKTK